jgi:ribosome-associated protein
MRDVVLRKEPVELHKILKFEGLVPSGGVAKLAIESGDVLVNGEVETRKRKKIVSGDIIEFNGEQLRLVAAV